MNTLKIYSEKDIASIVKRRAGETKFGEKISFIENLEDLKKHASKYVLVGIPEDIGVRANHGNAGTSKAWGAALGSLLNIQSNYLTNAENLILLGEINCDDQMQQAEVLINSENFTPEALGELVSQIDKKVAYVIEQIVMAGKFPIIIGGGHNNSYGNIKGASEGLNSKINCINFDAHTDFRSLEHRHSGNGFSYAFNDGYLDKYFIFGLHRNYTSEAVFKTINENSDRIKFNLFEDISVQQKLTFSEAMAEAARFCADKNFGIELDMDTIEMMGSSALTPSGFSVTEARIFVSHFSKNSQACYLHICEGAPALGMSPNQIGKSIAYLVSDAISNL